MDQSLNKRNVQLGPLVSSGLATRGQRARPRLGRLRPLPSAQIVILDSGGELAHEPESAAVTAPPDIDLNSIL
jgi:hypothetical protein